MDPQDLSTTPELYRLKIISAVPSFRELQPSKWLRQKKFLPKLELDQGLLEIFDKPPVHNVGIGLFEKVISVLFSHIMFHEADLFPAKKGWIEKNVYSDKSQCEKYFFKYVSIRNISNGT